MFIPTTFIGFLCTLRNETHIFSSLGPKKWGGGGFYIVAFQTYSVNLRGVAGPYPFPENIKNVCIIPILVLNKL